MKLGTLEEVRKPLFGFWFAVFFYFSFCTVRIMAAMQRDVEKIVMSTALAAEIILK